MKQKYLIARNDKKTDLVISEFVEMATNEFSLLTQQTYKFSDINKAWKAGEDQLIKAFRSPNFFPPIDTAQKIVAAIGELIQESDKTSVEIMVDDVRVMNELDVDVDEIHEEEEDLEDLDEILTDDDEEEDLSAEEDE